MEKKLLKAKEIVKSLEERGVLLSETTLRRYVYKGIIPKKFIVSQKHGMKVYYYFKPEVVDFLIEKLSEN